MISDVNEKDFTSLKNIPFAPAYKHTLVSVNSGFRTEKPVCNREKCNGCFLCYLYCPDGVISKEGESIKIDYDYCKGCGICQKICRKDAIHMEKER